VTELVDANGKKLGMLKQVAEDDTFQENDVVSSKGRKSF
jgi:hypothetical protein